MSYEDDNWWMDRWEDDADENDSCGYSDDDREDFHADEAVGYVSYGDDNPFGD